MYSPPIVHRLLLRDYLVGQSLVPAGRRRSEICLRQESSPWKSVALA
jgi:hypothetical protein